MNIRKLNYLLQQLFFKGDVLSFDELYHYKEKYVENYINSIYTYVVDKSLNLIDDVIQESWLNIWLISNINYVTVKSEKEINNYIKGIIIDTVIQINNN